MQSWKERLGRIGDVAAFDYDYIWRVKAVGAAGPIPCPCSWRLTGRRCVTRATAIGQSFSLAKAWVAESDATSRLKNRSPASFVSAIRFAAVVIRGSCATKCCANCEHQSYFCRERAILSVRSASWHKSEPK